MSEQMQIWTKSRIAKHLKVDQHRVEYVMNTRNIRPITTAGAARVYDSESVAKIKNALREIEQEKKRAKASKPR